MSDEQDYKDYQDYLAYQKRQKALVQSKANIAADAEGYKATSGMTGGQKFLAGAGSGMVDVGRKAANLALPKSLEPEWATKEAIAGQGARDEDLLSTGAGLAGNIVGGAVATAPVGMGAGAALGAGARGLSTITNVPRLARALEAAGKVQGVGGRVAQGAAQGGVEGALLASPDSRGAGAGMGAAMGGGIPLVGGAVGKVGRFLSKDRRSDAAKILQGQMDKVSDDLGYTGAERPMIPASQALEPGIMKQVYEGFVANMPGASAKLRGQYDQAMGGFRQAAIKEAAPKGTNIGQIFQHGDDLQESLGFLKDSWDDAFDAVNTRPMRVPGNFWPQGVKDQLKQFEIVLPVGQVTGKELTTAKTQIQGLIDELPTGPLGKVARDRLVAQKTQIDNLIKNQLPPDMVAKFDDNLSGYKKFEDLMAAAKTNPGTSAFTPKALAAQTSKRAGRKGLFGDAGPLQDLGYFGQEALQNFPSRAGVFQTLAAVGAAQGITGGVTGNEGLMGSALATVLIPLAGARGLSNRTVQRMIMEGLKKPKAMEELIDKFPEAADVLRRYTTAGAVAAQAQE
jgi:hypothetical protein